MSPEKLSAYVKIVIRDVIMPLTGVFLGVYLPVTEQFSAWQLPLLAILLGVPLLAPRSSDGPS